MTLIRRLVTSLLENFDLKKEKQKFRKELRGRIEDVESRLTKVEQDFSMVPPQVSGDDAENKRKIEQGSVDTKCVSSEEQHKKSISEEIRQRNREKKVQRESAIQSDQMSPVSPPYTSETVAIVDSNSSRDINLLTLLMGFPKIRNFHTDVI
jgi:hypothetical protein